MCFVILRDLPFFWPFCEAYTRTALFELDTYVVKNVQYIGK